MSYIDGFVTPVAADRKDAYRAMSETAAVVFKDHGAVRPPGLPCRQFGLTKP